MSSTTTTMASSISKPLIMTFSSAPPPFPPPLNFTTPVLQPAARLLRHGRHRQRLFAPREPPPPPPPPHHHPPPPHQHHSPSWPSSPSNPPSTTHPTPSTNGPTHPPSPQAPPTHQLLHGARGQASPAPQTPPPAPSPESTSPAATSPAPPSPPPPPASSRPRSPRSTSAATPSPAPLPPAIFLLRRLQSLDVSRNAFNGTFSDGVGQLGELRLLDAFSNCFVGPLPRGGLVALRRLEHLNLGGSYFNGSIPAELGSLRQLRFLHLAGNALSGTIPKELGQLTLLERMEIGYNAYNSTIPKELGNLRKLQYLDIAVASVSGPLPASLGTLTHLQSLFLFKNKLTGTIPPHWSSHHNLHSSSLQVLDLSDNALTGPIPSGLGDDLTDLTTLNLMSNALSGTIPPSIGVLRNLEVLQLWNNSLTGRLPPSLGAVSRRLVRVDVSSNALSGPVPAGLCAGNRLARLILFNNRFDSSIPPGLAANCSSLWRVRLESNRFTGAIPAGFGNIANLTYLDLSGNLLTGGGIPEDLVTSASIEYLNVSGNPALGGALPDATWQAPRMQVFSAEKCGLVGQVPKFGPHGCANLYRLELAGNELVGEIPEDIGRCKRLVSLRMQRNEISGEIPAGLAALPSITEVDLSWNALTGGVPPGFANCTTLETFDVSFNRLSPAASPRAGEEEGRHTAAAAAMVWAAVAFAGVAVLAGTARWMQLGQGSNTVQNGGPRADSNAGVVKVTGPWRMTAFQKLGFTADDVARCVELVVVGSGGIIGAGSSGTVYRAKMPNGEVIAVKRLWHSTAQKEAASEQQQATRCNKRRMLVAEVEVLGQLRHRNIVRLLGWCTNGGETTMLLYEYMPNGSLHDLLHGANTTTAKKATSSNNKAVVLELDWDARHRIALGVAQGVSYLHHDCIPAVAHRDLKPSNILLDADMEPRVADFGVAKALHGNGGAPIISVVAGSYGYIAPEYTYTLQVDEKSDVYSYGVVLLEILTGRRPAEAEYGEGSTIVDWVRRKVTAGGEAGLREITAWAADETCCDDEERDEMALAMRVALLCTSKCPKERPSMRDVVSMLQETRREDRKNKANKETHKVMNC
ncbi:hypothetical protein PR202_gb28823 [Eleusine coracana subsp. coracana]|uniref:non-specific serine/threonine protein kinase n=1 Tax=Eleusine coracana subsp. coracana TaxID=191504 RepID=A0AAV5FVE9_ELECO|nr:hypothetical protein PR202_gb28823 [Eleusine coracana subsp. coracana]